MKKLFIVGFLAFALSACDWSTNQEYKSGSFSETPVNFEEINTEYDDYNSTAPSFGETFPLCFSSTRKTNGGTFDIVYKLITIRFSKDSGKLDIYEETNGNLDVLSRNGNLVLALNKINTSADELGPYLIPEEESNDETYQNGRYNAYTFLYSTNETGNQDIMFTNNINDAYYETPQEVTFLNSEYDDAYPTFNNDFSKIYFTSNRASSFDIYSISTDNSKSITDILTGTTSEAVKNSILSSSSDDKCPFVIRNFMVFASNREGGFGGYDLYYSKFENGQWSTPQNFGDKINTEYDEYRPIVRIEEGFTNDFMLFSSNRPGGLGGFDLYYVGIDNVAY